ncbi:GntR family transcriptional regulator [Streptomyces mexicanus]|uniref:GntR family transcriptional regulator n=1 Tax=Streptomyces mexicanus TaxID=178566 RepID=UPI00365B860F
MPETTGYAEIAEYFRQQIQDGTLQPGDTMPSFKKVASQFGVAITTVNRAYRLLKAEGLTVAKPGVGTVVAAPISRNGGTPQGAQMNRGLMAFIEQQEDAPHTELGDCIKLVAASVWNAAWRQARADQSPDPEIEGQIDHLIEHSDFLRKALYRHNWRNVSTVLAAFRDAGLAGSSDVAAFYTHVNHIPDN